MNYKIEIDCVFDQDINYKEHFYDGEDVDSEIVDWITSELDNGNTWAWCVVRVSLVFPDLDIRVDEYLCGCSYEDEYAFKTGGYYEDMVQTCKQKIADAHNLTLTM